MSDLDGTMVVVGIPEKQTPINPSTLIMARRNLAGSAISGIRETQEMLDFCSKHNIVSDIEVAPIQKVNEVPLIVDPKLSDLEYTVDQFLCRTMMPIGLS